MNARLNFNAIFYIVILSTIISCSTININGSISEYKAPEKGIVLSIISEQNEIRIRNPNGYTDPRASILIVALDEVYFNNKRLNALDSVLSDLKGFNFVSQISKDIRTSVSEIGWLIIDKKLSSRTHLHNILKVGTHRLLFNTKYEFTPNMDSIEVTVFVSLEKVTKVKQQLTKKVRKYTTIYENRYKYISPIANPIEIIRNDFPGTNNELKKILGQNKKKFSPIEKIQLMSKYWSFNNSSKVKKYLMEAINRTKKMISHDLSFKKSLTDTEYYNSLVNHNQFYWKIDAFDNRLFLESNSWFKKGNLCSIPVNAETHRCTDSIHH